MKCRIANMNNLHTSSVCRVDLFLPVVLLMHHKLVKLTSDVICGARVGVPRYVNAIALPLSIVHGLLFSSEVTIKPFPALLHCVLGLLTQLTD
jgi:hypothetical protein